MRIFYFPLKRILTSSIVLSENNYYLPYLKENIQFSSGMLNFVWWYGVKILVFCYIKFLYMEKLFYFFDVDGLMITNSQEQITSGILVSLRSYLLSPFQTEQSIILSNDCLM